MSGWRHTVLVGGDCGSCWHESFQIGAPQDRICTAPIPDPASPCGFEGCEGWPGDHDFTVGRCQHPPKHDCHPHVPTRCQCGHPIEAER